MTEQQHPITPPPELVKQSEKEQALDLLDRIEQGVLPWALSELNVIRRVLKAVPGD